MDFIKWLSYVGIIGCCFVGCVQGMAWFGAITTNTYGNNTRHYNEDTYDSVTYPNENYNDTINYEDNF